MARQKVVLLKSAWRRGVGPFLSLLLISIRDKVWSKRLLIYYVGPDEIPNPLAGDGSRITYRRIDCWEDWPSELRDRLLREQDALGWGQVEWFDRGWWVWSGEIGGKVATFCWVYPRGGNDSFFKHMAPGSEFIWQVTTLPEFRGRGLYARMMIELMRTRVADGVTGIYGTFRDWNLTSRRVLPKVGFRVIGEIVTNKLTKTRRWVPVGSKSA